MCSSWSNSENSSSVSELSSSRKVLAHNSANLLTPSSLLNSSLVFGFILTVKRCLI